MKENNFYKLFSMAGFQKIGVRALPNEHHTSLPGAFWYSVKTEFGEFILGWHEEIISINWGDIISDEMGIRNEINIAPLFDSENVTKNTVMIHALGWDKAQEYLTHIYNHLKN